MNADGGTLHVQTVGGNVRVSDAGKVWRNYGEPIGQSWNNRFPHQRGLGIAVQQDERCTVAGGHVMQLDAINLGSVGSNGLVCGLSVSCGGEGDGETKWPEHSEA